MDPDDDRLEAAWLVNMQTTTAGPTTDDRATYPTWRLRSDLSWRETPPP